MEGISPLLSSFRAQRQTRGNESFNYMGYLIFLSVSFLFSFTAFQGVQNLASSLDLNQSSGSTAVAVLYVFFTIACLFGPYMVEKFGSKLCMLVQQIFIGILMLGYLYPYPWILYPSAALVGIGSSAIWTGQGDYVSFIAEKYAKSKGLELTSASGLFQGIFFCIFQLSQVSGNLISSFIMQSDRASSTSGDDKPSQKAVNFLFLVYIICDVVAVFIIALFVPSKQFLQNTSRQIQLQSNPNDDPTQDDVSFIKPEEDETNLRDLASDQRKTVVPTKNTGIMQTILVLKNPKLFLLVPLFLAFGFESGFLWGDFTAQIIKKSIGQSNIGFAMAVFGGVNAIASITLGKISDIIGRPIVFFLGFLSHFACALYLLLVEIKQNDYTTIFVIAGVWAIGDCVWNAILSATLSGCLNKSEVNAAFSNLKMWQSIAIATSFFYSNYLSIDTKLIILISSLVFGIISYFVNVAFFSLESRN